MKFFLTMPFISVNDKFIYHLLKQVPTFFALSITCIYIIPGSSTMCLESGPDQLPIETLTTGMLAGETIPGFLLLGGMVFFVMNLAKKSAETLIAQKNSTTLVDTSVDKLELPFSKKGEALVRHSEHGWTVTQRNYEYLKEVVGFTDGKEKFEADITHLFELREQILKFVGNIENVSYQDQTISDGFILHLERWVQVFRSLPANLDSQNDMYATFTKNALDQGLVDILVFMNNRDLTPVQGKPISVVELLGEKQKYLHEWRSLFEKFPVDTVDAPMVIDNLSDKVVVENIPLSWHEFLSMTPTEGLDSPTLLMILAGIIGGVGGTLLIEKVLVSKD
jgi:hypothetical protein